MIDRNRPPLIHGIPMGELVALSDEALWERRLGLAQQEAALRERRATDDGDDPVRSIRLRDALAKTIGSIAAVRTEQKRRSDRAGDSGVILAAARWSYAFRAFTVHEDGCDCDPCMECNVLGDHLVGAETALLAALDVKYEARVERKMLNRVANAIAVAS